MPTSDRLGRFPSPSLHVLLFVLLTTALLPSPSSSFVAIQTPRRQRSVLFLAKVKRGKLASSMEIDAPLSKKQQKRSKVSRKKPSPSRGRQQQSGNISPALAQWMEQQPTDAPSSEAKEQQAEDDAAEEVQIEVVVEEDEPTFSAFADVEETPSRSTKKASSKNRRKKQTERKAAEKVRDRQIQALVKQLQGIVEGESKDLFAAMSTPLQTLLAMESSNLRQLTAGARTNDYRLLWVGSDDAICHVGTGLHKVPLARLQEIFITLGGRNAILVQEVIRVLGPFPNVKNVLQGTCSSAKASNSDLVDWKLEYESMIDGAGKELLAGKEENARVVDLQVMFSDPSILIAVVPPEEGVARRDPLHDNGKNLLVFVREEDLAEKLEALRVA